MSRDSIEMIRLKGAEAAFGNRDDGAFLTAAEEAPFMIRSLGLGSGIASIAAKKGERPVLAGMIAKWLFDPKCPATPFQLDDQAPAPNDHDHKGWVRALLGKISTCDRAEYRIAQIEAMGYAVWLKRLAQAFCEKDGK